MHAWLEKFWIFYINSWWHWRYIHEK